MNLEDFWYDVDRQWEMKDTFLSDIDPFDCKCPICDISEEEKNRASKEMNHWINSWS